MMDTGPLPALPISHSPRRLARTARETTVDELFSALGTGSWAPSSGASAAEHRRDTAHEPALAGRLAAAPQDPALPAADEFAGRPARSEGRGASVIGAGAELGQEHRFSPRLRVVADTSGPRVRLGLLWFVLGAAALLAGRWAALLVFAPVAAVGAVQTGSALQHEGRRSRPLIAGACAMAVVAAAVAPTSRVVGFAVLIALVASLISALHLGGFDVESAGLTVRSWLGVGLAAASPVVFASVEPSLAVLLFVLVCSYDAGDFLVGTASDNGFEGPIAGIVGVLAVGCGAAMLHPGSLSHYSLWPAVIATAVACPLGQLLGSAILPRAGSFAPALRRLDSLLLVGPLWILLFG